MTMPTLRRRGTALTAAVLSASFALAACGGDGDDPGTASGETRTVTADNGAVEIPADPQRVVTLGNTTLPLIDMGGAPVGVTEVSDSELALIPETQQAAYAAAVNLGTSADQVDMEQLASLEPDLILAQFPASEFEQVQEELEAVAPTVFWGLDVEWKALADGVAEAGDVTEGLSEQKTAFEDKIAQIETTYGAIIADTAFVNLDRWASSDPGTFSIADFGCVEIAQGDLGMDFPRAAEGEDPLGWTSLPFEQLAELSQYDVITYPVDAEGDPTESFAPVVETNTWQALPAVESGRALGLFCPGNNSYGPVLQYLDSLDSALATLPATT
ncbi:ABC transporter substrate-binding protein [Glycomyces sp. NPDC047010]|uniref:ABC transporter substrate-binding protein n=1 Tax=Glycomyces sp. NPDC047010 TaxID=3155023 RepID=UPI0033DBE780